MNASQLENLFLKGWKPYLWIYFVALGVYFQTLGFDFSPYDDPYLIITQLDWFQDLSNLPALFSQPVFKESYYRPVLLFSFMVDAMTGKGSPVSFHLTNVILHMIASILLFHMVKKLGVSMGLSFLLALIFTVHPIHVQAVAWIPGRNDILLAIFIMSSWICFINYWEGRKPLWLAWHLILFAGALLTKETAIVVPFLLAFFYYLIGKSKNRPTTHLPHRSDWTQLLRMIGLWILIMAVWLWIRSGVVTEDWGIEPLNYQRAVKNTIPIFLMYSGKLLIPIKQAIIPIAQTTSLLPGIITIFVIGILIMILGIGDKNIFLIGTVWLLAFILAPTVIASLQSKGEYYEHRAYLPSVGFFLLLSQLKITELFKRLHQVKQPVTIAIILVFIILGLFGTKTVVRSRFYKDPLTFASTAVRETSGYAELLDMRGLVYVHNKDYDKGIADFTEAIKIYPKFERVYLNRGGVFLKKEDYKNAIEDFDRALALDSNYQDAYINRGLAFLQIGDDENARRDFLKAQKLDPKNPLVYTYLGNLNAKKKEYDSAMDYYDKAISANPRQNWSKIAEAYYHRGVLFEELGEHESALHDYTKAVDYNSRQVYAYFNRGTIFLNHEKYAKAFEDFNKVIAIDPNNAKAYNNRGLIFAKAGEFEKALEDFNQSIELDSGYINAYNNRGVVLSATNQYSKALEDFNKAIGLDTKYGDAYVNRAITYFHMEEFDRSKKDMRLAQQLGARSDSVFLSNLKTVR